MRDQQFSHPGLIGRFPIGLPVLIHNQFGGDGLETHIGLVTHCEDFLVMAAPYYGRIDAIVCESGGNIRITRNVDHASKRTSACYWLHLSDAALMRKDFENNWNSTEVAERLEFLFTSITPK